MFTVSDLSWVIRCQIGVVHDMTALHLIVEAYLTAMHFWSLLAQSADFTSTALTSDFGAKQTWRLWRQSVAIDPSETGASYMATGLFATAPMLYAESAKAISVQQAVA